MKTTHERTWVLVADSSRGRLFELNAGALSELQDFSHPASRARLHDLETDEPGRSYTYGRGNPTRHAVGSHTDSHEHETQVFAKELTAHLGTCRARSEFQHLVLIAPARFLGELRKHADAPLQATISRTIEKNITQLRPEEILAYLS